MHPLPSAATSVRGTDTGVSEQARNFPNSCTLLTPFSLFPPTPRFFSLKLTTLHPCVFLPPCADKLAQENNIRTNDVQQAKSGKQLCQAKSKSARLSSRKSILARLILT